jgi:arylformamidase
MVRQGHNALLNRHMNDSRMVDVSHVIESGMITYKGLPAPIVCDYLSREQSREHYAEGVTFQIGKIEMVANTGTYLDSPFHRYAHGQDLADLRLQAVANLDCVVVRVPSDRREIDAASFSGRDLSGKAVLVHTGWDRHWRTDAYFEGHPFLTTAAAEWLAETHAALVGIDSFNIDDVEDRARPVHSVLLGAGIPIVEHLCNLRNAPDTGGRFFSAPVKVRGCGTFPVRAFVVCE